jgi:hypothetical protein
MVGLGMTGFGASAALHLGTFAVPMEAGGADALALALFGAAFVPLAAMLVRLRGHPAVAAPGRRWGLVDWRALLARVPPGARVLVGATAAYALMNLTLSLLLGLEQEATRAGEIRLLSGHLLLLYLLPLVYFLFADPGG